MPESAKTPADRVLIADDQPDVLRALRLLLKGHGYDTETVNSPAEVVGALEGRDFDVVLIDLNYTRDTTSGQEGLDLLEVLHDLDRHLPVIVMTAWGSVELAVEAMRRGAGDFVQKPWENERLLAILRTQIALGRAQRTGERLEAENELLRGPAATPLIAAAPAMAPVLEIVERVGPSDANVLVTGENGTGKGLVARILHEVSPRRDRPFITVDLGGLPENVFESELFGHVKGAFTDAREDRVGRVELADGGTLFLDEIANIPLAMQAKLLRVVETGAFERVGSSKTRSADVRVIAATNAELDALVERGDFRPDLLFRLNTVEIRLPPLRERREDVPALAACFLKRHATQYAKAIDTLSPEAHAAIMAHRWPGNVRELDHAIERAVLMAGGERIEAGDLGLRAAPADATDFDELSLEEAELVMIKKAIARFDGNVQRAAEHLGVSRSGLYRRLSKHGLGSEAD